MAFDPRAEEAFAEFAAECGREAWKMPTSCETYLNQYLAKFPVELELLVAALRVGVPKRIAAADARVGYDDFLSQLADKFAAAAHTDREAAVWAVGAWAFALGKPVGYTGAEPLPNAGRVYEPGGPPPDDKMLHRVMTAIVTAGGLLGGAIGGLMLPLVMLATEVAADYHTKGGPMGRAVSGESSAAVTVLAVLIAVVVVGLSSGLGAFAGWLYGRGEEQPWASFGAAFGTALASNVMIMFCLGPVIGAPLQFAAVFVATYKSASRGGREFV